MARSVLTIPRTDLSQERTALNVVRAAVNTQQNYLTYSKDLSNANWFKLGLTATANQALFLDGLTTMYKLEETAINNTHFIQTNDSGPAIGQVGCYSVYARAGTLSWCFLSIDNSSIKGVYFNLSNGTVGSVGANIIDYGIEEVAGYLGLYRIWIVAIPILAGFPSQRLYSSPANGGPLSYLGVVGNYIYASDFQAVRANWPGELTPTTSAKINTTLGIRNKVL